MATNNNRNFQPTAGSHSGCTRGRVQQRVEVADMPQDYQIAYSHAISSRPDHDILEEPRRSLPLDLDPHNNFTYMTNPQFWTQPQHQTNRLSLQTPFMIHSNPNPYTPARYVDGEGCININLSHFIRSIRLAWLNSFNQLFIFRMGHRNLRL